MFAGNNQRWFACGLRRAAFYFAFCVCAGLRFSSFGGVPFSKMKHLASGSRQTEDSLIITAMPSRKKKAGKARKAAKVAKAVEEDVQEEGKEQDALELQMQRLTMIEKNNEDLAEIEKNKEEMESLKLQMQRNGGVQKCLHLPELEFDFEGEPKSRMFCLCQEFKKEFTRAYNDTVEAGGKNMMDCMLAGVTATEDKFVAVWNHTELVGYVSSCYVAQAVTLMLDGNDRIAGVVASIAYFLEESIATCIKKTQPMVKWQRVLEASNVDLHSLVEFLRKRIPCQCLNKKYEEVRSLPRMGICSNPNCTLPDRKAKRSEMFYCGRCRFICYCSTECQKADWSCHKKVCKEVSRLKGEFTAKHNG